MIFDTLQIPNIFFAEHLSDMPGDYLKIYLYLVFLSKYNGEIGINDLSKKLALPINIINEGMKYLEKEELNDQYSFDDDIAVCIYDNLTINITELLKQ